MDTIKTFEAGSHRSTFRFDRGGRRYIRVLVRAADVEGDIVAPPLQLALVLDHSGSMTGPKWNLAKRAALEALALLRPVDRFSLVVFSSAVHHLAVDLPATAQSLALAAAGLAGVVAHGNTALLPALQAGADLLALHCIDGAVQRLLVLTDGQANIGPRDTGSFVASAAAWRKLGVSTSAFGLGEDFHEELLVALTRAGQGQFTYVANEHALVAALQREIADAKVVVAQDVVIELRPSPGIRIRCISALDAAWAGDHFRVAIGALVAKQEMEVVLRADIGAGVIGSLATVELRLCDADGPLPLPVRELQWLAADKAVCDADIVDLGVARCAAEALAARAEIRMADANRRDDFDAVEVQLRRAVEALTALAGTDAAIQQHIELLVALATRMRRKLSSSAMKEVYMSSVSRSRGRHSDGSKKLH